MAHFSCRTSDSVSVKMSRLNRTTRQTYLTAGVLESTFKPPSASTPTKHQLNDELRPAISPPKTSRGSHYPLMKLNKISKKSPDSVNDVVGTASSTTSKVGMMPLIAPSVTAVLLEEDEDALNVANYTGPYKQLWHLLLGTTDIMSKDVVHEELTRRCNAIISGLMFYDAPIPFQLPQLKETSSTKDKVKLEIMKTLSVTESVAMELLCLFIVFEYKGVVKSLTELLPTEQVIKTFVKEVYDFYKRERICLLYCAQVILSNSNNYAHRFSEIFSAFVGSASMVNWSKWLCLSLDKVQNEDEYVQVLHTLAILLYKYGNFDGVITQFNEHFKFGKRSAAKHSTLYAEGLLMFSFLQSGNSEHDPDIEKFLSSHLRQLDENPYFYGAVVSAFARRCGQNNLIRGVIQQSPQPECCAQYMSLLISEYEGTSFRNRHELAPILVKCVYLAAETILVSYDKASFGKEKDWYHLLSLLLRDEGTAYTFLCEHPEELTRLYNDAWMKFPVEIEWILAFWEEICHNATSEVPAEGILERITEINSIAVELKEIDPQLIRANGHREWLLLEDINVGGVVVNEGTVGLTVREEQPVVINFELQLAAKNVTVWEVLMEVVIRKAYDEYPSFEKNTIEKVFCIAKFLTRFSETAGKASTSLLSLFKPVIEILQRVVYEVHEPHRKSICITLLLDVVKAGTIYNVDFLLSRDEPALWPTPEVANYVTDIILAYESVLNSEYSVTKTFLRNVTELFIAKEDVRDLTSNCISQTLVDQRAISSLIGLRSIYMHAVHFILENVYPSFVRWRMSRPSDQFEIIRDTFRVFCQLFEFEDTWLNGVKEECCRWLLAPGNSLLAVLTTDGDKLQDTWIRPSKENQFFDQTIFYALTLMTHLANFDIKTLKMLDSNSNLTLVKELGKLARHRLNPNLPTLAINLLGKMALELDISLLACFGNGIDSFRDLLQQRLDYKSEAVKLKVAILNFLTVCAQSQPGLIQHFFQDDSSTTCLLELLSETNSNLPVASLCLIRALLRKGNTVFKNHGSAIWIDIIKPIKALKEFPYTLTEQKVISYTIDIFSFEVYRSTIIEKEFSPALSEILNTERLLNLMKVATNQPIIPVTKKCIYAIKHFLTLVLALPDFELFLADCDREACLGALVNDFWTYIETNGDIYPSYVVELMLVLGPLGDSTLLEKLCNGLLGTFKTTNVQVQVPLLTLIHKSIRTITSDISVSTVDNIVCIIAHVFSNAAKIYEALQVDIVRPFLGLAASTMYAIIASHYCKDWVQIFQQRMVVSSIICVAEVGLQKAKAPEVVHDCLGCLVRLARSPKTAGVLRNADLTMKIYMPMARVSCLDTTDGKWIEVFMCCCELNTSMLETEKINFLENSFNFWIIHVNFIIFKLLTLTDLISHSYLQTPDQNFHTIKQLLSFIKVVFHAITVMLPYFQIWRLKQRQTLQHLLDGVRGALETSVSLLSQPNHLLLVITKPTKGFITSPAFKLTPQLLDVQTKLWEVVSMGVHLYFMFGTSETEFISRTNVLPIIFTIIGLCGRVMSKHGDKKSHPIVNVTSEVTMSLEKGLTLILSHVVDFRKNYEHESKEQQTYIQETITEIISVCEIVRRLGLPRDDYSIAVCSALDDQLKKMNLSCK